jgi:hypothetical protein
MSDISFADRVLTVAVEASEDREVTDAVFVSLEVEF